MLQVPVYDTGDLVDAKANLAALGGVRAGVDGEGSALLVVVVVWASRKA
jgi:hypothetical protein